MSKNPEQSLQEVGARVRWLRDRANLTQQQFASDLGVSVGYLSKLENGLCPPGNSMMYLLGRHYGVRQEWLIEGKPPPPEVKPGAEIRDTTAAYGAEPQAKAPDPLSLFRFAHDKDILARAEEISRAAKCSLPDALTFLWARRPKQ